MTHRTTNEFGFSNDAQWFNEIVAWREAAIKNGWSIEPTYQSESQDRKWRKLTIESRSKPKERNKEKRV
jgi:hypothetical protein